MHGGTVEVRSEGRGGGSEFIVRLPGIRADAEAEPRVVTGGAGGGGATPERVGSRRVVVADDNADGADSLAALLRLAGHEVRVAYDGPSALEASRAFRPEIVLLDIGLPGMNGYEVARRIRGLRIPGGTLLVAVTGYGQEEDISRSSEAGFDHHLTKPVDIKALRHLLGDGLPRTEA
jgi:CheY-like chemotaxis protein